MSHLKFIQSIFVVLLMLLSSSYATAGRYDGIIKGLDDFMGSGATVVKNDAKSFRAVSDNGNQVRMDYQGHGYKPHAHIETPNPNGGKPLDAPGTPHHIYFNDKK